MVRRFRTRRIIGSFLIDWLGTILLLVLSAFIRAYFVVFPSQLEESISATEAWEQIWLERFLLPQVIFLVAIIWPIFLLAFSVYKGSKNRTIQNELANVFMAVSAATLVLAGVLYMTYRQTARGTIVIFIILDLGLVIGWRLLLYANRYYHAKTGKKSISYPMIIIGAGRVGQNILAELMKFPDRDVWPIGFVDDDPDKHGEVVSGIPVLAGIDEIADIVQVYNIKDAIVALPLAAYNRMIEVSQELQILDVRVHVIPDLFSLIFPNAKLEIFSGIPLMDLGQPGISGIDEVFKRIFDFLVVLSGIIILAPIFLIIAILVKITSPGPIFFRQKRIGLQGSEFDMIKFRTMYDNAEEMLIEYLSADEALFQEWETFQKLKDDPRITSIGKHLRRFSLDELPQLWNVIKGDMSLVGPRPFFPDQLEIYGDKAYQHYIHFKPGITGMWQISGRNETSFAERIQWDQYYVRNWSMALDIKIFARTLWVVFRGDGAR